MPVPLLNLLVPITCLSSALHLSEMIYILIYFMLLGPLTFPSSLSLLDN